jgi:hypothetical protein
VAAVVEVEPGDVPLLVGHEDLVAPAVLVDQRQLCARVRALPAADGARARGLAREVEFELGDKGLLARLALGRDGRNPVPLPDREHGLAHLLGRVHPDRETDVGVVEEVEQVVDKAGRVRAPEDVCLSHHRPRQLGERLLDALDLVGCGVRPGVARPQYPASASSDSSR